MKQIWIDTREGYDFARARGYEPLVDRRFRLEIGLRVAIQQELFGKGHTPEENEKFYRWCWEHKLHVCEECMKPLHQYSAVHISHILSRKEFPQGHFDPRNVNILCFNCHNRWEYRNTRHGMRIEPHNDLVIAELREDYLQYSKLTHK